MMIVPKLLRISPKPQESSPGSSQPLMAGLPYYPNGVFGNGTMPSQPVIIVRAEEALIVVLVLALWVAAIALFFNRWGKIRMLEPYQPKFIQQHRPSCPLVDAVQHHSFSKFNVNGDIFLNPPKLLRPRQNSVFVGSSMVTLPMNAPRKVKSAFDLQNLVFSDPALNKSAVRINFGAEYFRRPSLLPVYPPKRDSEHPHTSGERRLSFKDLVDIERTQRVQCYLEKEPTEAEVSRKNRKIGETKQRSTISTQSSLSDSRHNSITNQDFKAVVAPCSKCHDRKSSLLPVQRELVPGIRDPEGHELRPEARSGVSNFRRNSTLLLNSIESERNFLSPRENVKSGVQDFRRNSMLIINNLTEDIGCRSIGRNYSLGGSNIALGGDFLLTGRRNSVIPPYEAKQKLSVPHVSVPKSKSGGGKTSATVHVSETKYMSSQKPSKSLDCGDAGGRGPRKQEGSQPSLLSDAKKQFLMPIVPQNFAGSSASLNADFGHANRTLDERRSTGNLSSGKCEFVHPQIIETRCYSPNKEETGGKCAASLEELGECQKEEEKEEQKPSVNLTTSLTNLNIKSREPLNVVTSSDGASTSVQFTRV